jgi:alpha-D-ribose 1-methylphosphonate 5-phosphate C-P lyase
MQKAVLVMMDEDFLAEIDAAYPTLGYGDRATFVRDAILKLMAIHGYKLPASYKAAPPRAGKGGRPKKSLLTAVEGTGGKTTKVG